MILFFNVKITDSRLSILQRPSWFKHDDRIDIFKYSLASYGPSKHLFDKIIIYAELDENYKNRTQELENYIHSVFEGKAIFRNFKCTYLNEWRNFCDEWLQDPNEVIWHSGNDDHVLLDYNLDVMISGINAVKNDPDPNCSFHYSHWPEIIRVAKYNNGILQEDKNTIKVLNFKDCDSMSALKCGRFINYWYGERSYDMIGNAAIPRTDELTRVGYDKISATAYFPTRELTRHFDGYSHVGNLMNHTPPLYIPYGFFDNNIKISIGTNDRADGYTTFNPNSEYLYAADQSGCDYRWISSDIPLFWRGKISEIIVLNEDIESRNKYFLELTKVRFTSYYNHIQQYDDCPIEWFVNQLK